MKFLSSLLLAALLCLQASAQKFKLITEDVTRFWEAYGNGDTLGMESRLEEKYFKPGTRGLRDFKQMKIKSAATLTRVIKRRPHYFAALKHQTDIMENSKPAIEKAFSQMISLYPKAEIPPVYFLIGAMNSGGTASDAGLLIGSEMYGRTADTDTTELSPWLKTVLKGMDQLPAIVSHEMIHSLQHVPENTLLAACLKEGSADFLGELISGMMINQHLHEWAKGKEKELWAQFKKDEPSNDRSLWLYNGNNVKDRPADLGYWLGYQIAKAYYDKAPDKKRAVEELLNYKNAEALLSRSGLSWATEN